MNPRQRRGVLFLGIAFVGAVAVFLSVLAYVNDVESQVGSRVTAYVVKDNVDPYEALSPEQLDKIEVPSRWLPETALRNLSDLTGQVTSAGIPKGTLLQDSNLMPQPTLEAKQREIAILVDAATGVAGKVQPGDYVDVWATFDQDTTGIGPRTKVIAQEVLVIDVGLQVETEKENEAGAVEAQDSVPVTFATTDGEVKALTFAESFAAEVRLVLRPPGDGSLVPGDERSYQETFGVEQDDTGGSEGGNS